MGARGDRDRNEMIIMYDPNEKKKSKTVTVVVNVANSSMKPFLHSCALCASLSTTI